MPPEIEIIVGTYEEFLLGYQLIKQDDTVVLKQTFADKSHAGPLKCVAVQGNWIASGGTDDRIFVYDMRKRKQSQILLSHSGTINALVFSPDLTHLLSGSDDGHMIATRVSNWTTEGDWHKAHDGSAVTHISCHPSSKLALSLGGDQVLHTWNLIKGRVAYKTNLKSKRTLGSAPDCLSWSTDGAHFTLTGPLVLEIWDIKTASVTRREQTPSKPICVAWLNETECLTGLENGGIVWVSLKAADDETGKAIKAHEARVKAIRFLNGTLATVSSDGEIKVWNCDLKDRNLNLIASTNIDCRPTCMGILDSTYAGNARPVQLSITVPKQKEKQPMSATVSTAPAARGVVTIEYDKDEKLIKESGAKAETSSSVEDDPTDNDVSDDNTSDDDDKEQKEPTAKTQKQQNTSVDSDDSQAEKSDDSVAAFSDEESLSAETSTDTDNDTKPVKLAAKRKQPQPLAGSKKKPNRQ